MNYATDIASTTGQMFTEIFPIFYFIIGLAVATFVLGIVIRSFINPAKKLFK